MPDHLSIGRSLQKQWLSQHSVMQQAFRAGLERPQRPEHDFIRSLFQHARGDSTSLIAYLRSDRPITGTEREQCAQVLEGVLDRKTIRGRPRNNDLRSAAMQAGMFYKEWKAENKQAGINDHGHSEAMKTEAIRFVVDELDPSLRADKDRVRELMERPASRRESEHFEKRRPHTAETP